LLIAASIVLALLGALAVWAWAPDRLRGDLEARYLARRTDQRTVLGVSLHVRDDGPRDGPALVFLHGIGSSLHTWEPWARSLAPRFRVVRFDLPGSGLSAVDPTGDYTDERSLALLAALMDQLGVAHATLIGNSLGGRLAWKFAARSPSRVDRLVLISPDGFASPGFEYDKAPDVPASLGLMRRWLPKPLLKMSLEPAYGNPARLRDEVVTRYYELLLAPGARDAMIERMRQCIPRDPRAELQRIRAPTLLLWGRRDGMIPFTNAADYLQAIRHSRLAALDTLGHVPQEEAPDEALAPLMDFLNAVDPS
jgi:pimeloyl-ACP methyl ester carboxylesterase